MTNSQIDLTSDLVIDMSTPDQMAIATQHDDGYAASRINASGRMLINGSVLSKGGLINRKTTLGRFGQVPPSAIMSMAGNWTL